MRTHPWARILCILVGSLCLVSCAKYGSPDFVHGITPLSPFPVTIVDQAGHQITVHEQPVRIASVTEGTDEILSSLVPKNRVTLVTTYASDPSESNILSWAKGIPKTQNANPEEIIATRPDLVLLATYTPEGVFSQLAQVGVPAYEFANFNSILDIEHNIQVVGQLVGNPKGATALIQMMRQKLNAVHVAVEKSGRSHFKTRVLAYSSWGYVAGRNTTVNDVIVGAGGINVASNINGWKQITDEQVVALNPDVILVGSDDKGALTTIYGNPALHTLTAVRNKQIFVIPSADLTSVSQYVYKGVEDVAHALYPRVLIPR